MEGIAGGDCYTVLEGPLRSALRQFVATAAAHYANRMTGIMRIAANRKPITKN